MELNTDIKCTLTGVHPTYQMCFNIYLHYYAESERERGGGGGREERCARRVKRDCSFSPTFFLFLSLSPGYTIQNAVSVTYF